MKDDSRKQKERQHTQGYLNKGEEDEMEIHGYEFYMPYNLMVWVMFILTCGLLRLVYHWWPQLYLYSTHRRCHLAAATKLLVIDTYEKRFKSIFVKTVRTIKPEPYPIKGHHFSLNGGPLAKDTEKERSVIRMYLQGGLIEDVNEVRLVRIKKLTYVWHQAGGCFLELTGLDQGISKDEMHSQKGLSTSQQALQRTAYGRNEVVVPTQSIPTLIALEVLNPFYMFQVFALIVWLSDNYYYYSIAIIIMSIFGIASSVIQTYRNQEALRETIHSSDIVRVKRVHGAYDDIESGELVPGDILEIPRHGCVMQCDAVLLKGQCIVNESMLTGESLPVTKTALNRDERPYSVKEDVNNTLFCGTKVIQARFYGDEKVEALVLRTGFSTAKGGLVRSILYPPPADYRFDQDSYKFIWVLAGIGLTGFIYATVIKAVRGMGLSEILIKGLDLFTIIIPPALPAAMTVGKLHALSQLKKDKVSCINSRVINVTGSLDAVCFDKTGTLTEDGLDLLGILPITSGSFNGQLLNTNELNDEHCLKGLATCHSLTLIDKEITGDPLDVKMFESTGWVLDEPEVPDTSKFDLLAPTVVRPKESTMEEDVQIGIVHQFQFASKLQRMSVVTKQLGASDLILYCKGSPEIIASLSRQNTIPSNLFERLREFTEKGYRVLALGWKKMEPVSFHQLQKLNRESVEKDLIMSGLIVMENRLKPETIPTIGVLKSAKIKVVMITGDNIQTAISVARECGIIGDSDQGVEVQVLEENNTPQLKYHSLLAPTVIRKKKMEFQMVEEAVDGGNLKIAMSGATWAALRDHFPDHIPKILIHGAVFARMSSDQKQQVIIELQKLGYFVAMCGDGANDCGALKAAHVGISLSEAEASVASPFTSQEPNISCVTKVIKEGRAALVTSFGVFKFMILYSITEFFSTVFLYQIDANLTDFEFLFIDVFLVVNLAFSFGRVKSYEGKLVSETPLNSILSPIPIASIVLQSITIVLAQLTSFTLVKKFPWYEPYKYDGEDHFASYENFAIYAVSQFQYIIMAVVFSQGPPYRAPLYTNKIFFTSLLITTFVCIYLLFLPAGWVVTLMEFRFPPNVDFPLAVAGIALANLMLGLLIEDFFLNRILFKKYRIGCNPNKKPYNAIKEKLRNEKWPPVVETTEFIQGKTNHEREV